MNDKIQTDTSHLALRPSHVSRRTFLRIFGALPLLSFTKFSNRNLPKVFLIGDSISLGYTPFVAKALEGKAIVTRPDQNCNGTKMGVEQLDRWLGNEKYDLIHFNFGLHDMKHVDPVTGEGSSNPEHPLQSDLDTYKKNLGWIVKRLQQTGAVLVFANTTPVVGNSGRGVLRDPEQLIRYNRAASKIMRKHKIVVNDLNSFAQSIIETQIPNDVHFKPEGYALLGNKVAAFVVARLREA